MLRFFYFAVQKPFSGLTAFSKSNTRAEHSTRRQQRNAVKSFLEKNRNKSCWPEVSSVNTTFDQQCTKGVQMVVKIKDRLTSKVLLLALRALKQAHNISDFFFFFFFYLSTVASGRLWKWQNGQVVQLLKPDVVSNKTHSSRVVPLSLRLGE